MFIDNFDDELIIPFEIGPRWPPSAFIWPHVGPMNFAIWVATQRIAWKSKCEECG